MPSKVCFGEFVSPCCPCTKGIGIGGKYKTKNLG